jgi:Type IV secretion system pilin/TrbC/VIRB2 pilin
VFRINDIKKKNFWQKTHKIFLSFFILAFLVSCFSITSLGYSQNWQATSGSIGSLDVLNIDCLFKGSPSVKNPSTKCTRGLVEIVIEFLRGLAPVLAILVIIWGGYQYFFSGVGSGKADGLKTIQAAVIGLFIVIFAQFITDTIYGSNGTGGILSNNNGAFQLNAQAVINLADTVRIFLVSLSLVVAVLVIIWGGYKYFFAGLQVEKKGGADSVRSATIGLVVIFVANGLFSQAITASKTIASSTSKTALEILNDQFITPVITDFTSVLVTLSYTVAVVVIVYGGYRYYFSGIDVVKDNGLKAVRSGVLGLITIFFASQIVGVLKAVFPVDSEFNPTTNEALNANLEPIFNAFNFIVSSILIPTSIGLSVFFFVIAGYNYTTSQGDTEKAKKANKAIRNALIGVIITLTAVTILQLVYFIVQGAGNGLIGN